MPNIQNRFVTQVGTAQGTIVIWAGTIAEIPSGWALCDGLDGRPNLLDKFVRGVNTVITDPGLTGGLSIVTLILTQLPLHSHTITEAVHFHQNTRGSVATAGGGIFIGTDSLSQSVQTEINSLTLGANTTTSGSGGFHNNIPPFFEIAYIIKL